MAGLPNLLDPYAPARNTSQQFSQLGQGIGDLGQTLFATQQQNMQVHPAIKEAIARILQGESGTDAAYRVRAHLAAPEAAQHIWSGPPPSQHPAVQQAFGPQLPGPNMPGAQDVGDPQARANEAAAGLGGPAPQPQMQQAPQSQAPQDFRPSRSVQEGLGIRPSLASFTNRDLDAFSKVAPSITADSRNATSLARMEERLNSIEREGAANRGTKTAIAENAEKGKGDRFDRMLEVRKTQMERNHQDRMAAIAAQLAKARESKGTDRQVAEERLAVQLFDAAQSGITRDVTSDISMAATPEFQAVIKKQQEDLESLRPAIEQIKKRALTAPQGGGRSSTSGAKPGVQDAATQRLLDALK